MIIMIIIVLYNANYKKDALIQFISEYVDLNSGIYLDTLFSI